MSDEEAFLRAIAANPADDLARLVYADWLEERGNPESTAKAEFLRTQYRHQDPKAPRRKAALKARLAELGRPMPTPWLAVVSRLPIENCPANRSTRMSLSVFLTPPACFEYECPKEWADLTPTDEAVVRYCGSCKQKVYYSATIREAQEHAAVGRCVTVDCAIPRRERDLEPRQVTRMRLDEVSAEREQIKRRKRHGG